MRHNAFIGAVLIFPLWVVYSWVCAPGPDAIWTRGWAANVSLLALLLATWTLPTWLLLLLCLLRRLLLLLRRLLLLTMLSCLLLMLLLLSCLLLLLLGSSLLWCLLGLVLRPTTWWAATTRTRHGARCLLQGFTHFSILKLHNVDPSEPIC